MRARRWVLGVLLVAGGVVGTQASAEQPRAGADRTITLITGDKVTLKGGDKNRPVIEGRKGITFESRQTAREWTIVPSDVRDDVRSGRLDRRLFDLEVLLRDGYDDAARGDIPVIVTGAKVAARSAEVTGSLATGAALSVPKKAAKSFLGQVPGGKVWLDRRLRTSLDQSVPQIGAPVAWQAGLTGKGIKVAVLDSGIDDTHPDLANQVADAKNFTSDPPADVAGHGTHVASAIAGKGADGYRGVAPDVKLLNGKVCDDYGYCSESAVLAGVEWAVAQGADVVNLSLGGPGGPELDPLEQAIAEYADDTLFIVAAGNQGGYDSIDSPGTAEQALTVGAIDRDGSLAEFSGQGPGPAGTIKPDLTAPGVGIVAARAAGSRPQEPVGERYARMSGTSMATPHVAGTAALLAQRNPDWTAADLKHALTSTADPNTTSPSTPYQQGSGRVDAARATSQSVIAATSGLSFGTARWPHADDKPVSRTLTYRNLGTDPVTLRLQPTFDAPADALTLSANQLTVPPGGSASVQVVSNTAHTGHDGLYSGRITATAGPTRIVVPLIVDKEVESYDVKLQHLGPDGKPSDTGQSSFWNLADGRSYHGARTQVVRLPKGQYLLDALFVDSEFRRLVQPTYTVNRAASLTIDARKAKPVRFMLPEKDAKSFFLAIGYERKAPNGQWLRTWFPWYDSVDKVYLGRLGSGAPGEQFTAFMVSHFGRIHPDGTLRDSPYLYGLVDTRRGHFFNGFQRKVVQQRLAHVIAEYQSPAGAQAEWVLFSRQLPVWIMGIGGPVVPPARIDRYLEPGKWEQGYEGEYRPIREYKAGETVHERWPS